MFLATSNSKDLQTPTYALIVPSTQLFYTIRKKYADGGDIDMARIQVSTNSAKVAMIGIGALFSYIWFGYNYPSVWIGVIGILLILAGFLVALLN